MSHAARALVALFTVVPMVSCAAIFGFEHLSDEIADASNDGGGPGPAAGDAAPDVVEAGGGPCGRLGVPDPPAAGADDGASDAGDAPPIVTAVAVFDFGIETGQGPSGLNLDRTCTTGLATSSCVSTSSEATFNGYGKDFGTAGGDNAGFSLLQLISQTGDAFKPSAINERLRAGEFGFVIRLSLWNGRPDDPEVFVEVFPARGVWKKTDAGALVAGGTPTFTPSDQWMRDARFQLAPGLEFSKIKSTVAYVSGGQLVAEFDQVVLPTSVPDDAKPLNLRLHAAYVTAKIAPADVDAGTSPLVDVTVVGRWKTSEFLDQVRQIHVENTLGVTSATLCESGPIQLAYQTIKKELCDGRDLRAASTDDGAHLPCDAISIGARLALYPVIAAGPFTTVPEEPPRCLDAAVPAGDDCP